jgi:hypothetical protein
MNDDNFDDSQDDYWDDYHDSERWVDDLAADADNASVTNLLKAYADTLSYTGIDGITTDGDEYEQRDLMARARDMIAGGKISEDSANFAKENPEQSEKHRTAARSAYKTMQPNLHSVAYEDGQPIYEVESSELWVSCIHAIVVNYGSNQSGVTALAARTIVDNLIYHLPDVTPEDFKAITFRTNERTILRWLEEASYVYYALTHTAAGDA